MENKMKRGEEKKKVMDTIMLVYRYDYARN